MSGSTSHRVAKNTLILYVQVVVGLFVGLYTSRIVLQTLGVEDFGIYNVVGGVITFFGLLNSAMSSSTSRYLTFALGRQDIELSKTYFGVSLFVHFVIAVCICLVAGPIGTWFIEHRMVIPDDRLDAAFWVFYCSIATTFLAIVNVPLGATIIAHEKMGFLAYFSIADTLLKLGGVLVLQVVGADKLKAYALILLTVQVIGQVVYWTYCYRNFMEAKTGMVWNKRVVKEMTSFAGWSLIGDSAVVLFTEGVNLLLNIFFGAVVNAARGIAVQVQGLLMRFVAGFQTAINPQITKSYAGNDLAYMHKLIYTSSKYSFFLMLLLSLPIFLEAKVVLSIWLGTVPEYTVEFLRFMFVISLIDCLANPLVLSAKATGRIRQYQLILGTLLLTIVPISYLFLKSGYSPLIVFWVHLIIVLIGQVARVLLIRRLINLSVRQYMSNVVWPCLGGMIVSAIFPVVCYLSLTPSIVRLLSVGALTVFSTASYVYFVAMEHRERSWVKNLVFMKKMSLHED